MKLKKTPYKTMLDNSFVYIPKDNKRHRWYAKFYFKSFTKLSILIEYFIYLYYTFLYKSIFNDYFLFRSSYDGITHHVKYKDYAKIIYNNRLKYIKNKK